MADFSIENAFAQVPASTVKTNLDTAFDSVITAIAGAKSAGALSANASRQYKDQTVDLAEQIAAALRDFTTTTTTTTTTTGS